MSLIACGAAILYRWPDQTCSIGPRQRTRTGVASQVSSKLTPARRTPGPVRGPVKRKESRLPCADEEQRIRWADGISLIGLNYGPTGPPVPNL